MANENEKILKARLKQKIDTTENWEKAGNNGFVPLDGEIIYYRDEKGINGKVYCKVGDGITNINNLPFESDLIKEELEIKLAENAIQSTNYTNKTHYGYSGDDLLIIPEGTTEIADFAYQNSNYKCVVIPSSVTSIGRYAFYECYGLTSITIPDSVTSIGHSAFQYCDSLTSITIPHSVTSIGDSAFSECSSLTSITIPHSVTSIGYYVFEGCDSLTSITIPDSVTSIGAYAFRSVPLKTIDLTAYITEDFPTLDNDVFSGYASDCQIKVVKGRKAELAAMTNWSDYADYIVEVPTASTLLQYQYDHVIATEDDFANLTKYYGRVLVRPFDFTLPHDITLSSYITSLEFEGNFNVSSNVIISADSNSNCELRGGTFVISEANCSITFKNFSKVESVIGNRVNDRTSFTFDSCKHITNSSIATARKCEYIDNCTVNSNDDFGFVDCKFICGIKSDTSLPNAVQFSNCSFISNVECAAAYTNCTYVDAETCQGFIPNDDVGKVQTLTDDGSYSTKAILEAPSTAADFESIPVIRRNTSGKDTIVDYKTVSQETGHDTIALRTSAGALRANFDKDFNGMSTEAEKNQQVVNLGYLNERLEGLGGGGKTIYRHLITVNNPYSGDYLTPQGELYFLLYLSDAIPITTYKQLLRLKSQIGDALAASFSNGRGYIKDTPEYEFIAYKVSFFKTSIEVYYIPRSFTNSEISDPGYIAWNNIDNFLITDNVTEV